MTEKGGDVSSGVERPKAIRPFKNLAILGLFIVLAILVTRPVHSGLVRTDFGDTTFTTVVGSERVDELSQSRADPGKQIKAMRWEGRLIVPENGNYSFYGRGSGGLRMWLNGTLVMDEWQVVQLEHSGYLIELPLHKGLHKVRVDYVLQGKKPSVDFRWKGEGIPDKSPVGHPYTLAVGL